MSFERNAQAVFVKPQFEEMGLNFIFNFSDAFLIRRIFVDEQHEETGEEGDNNHPNPWAHIPEGQQENFKYFPDYRIKYPHFSSSMFLNTSYEI